VSAPDVEVAVVGAGIAGLAAAADLAAQGREVVVLEASGRAGGAARSERCGGYLVERGAQSFRIGPAASAVLRAHGLDASLVAAAPASRERFVLCGGRLVAVPASAAAFATSSLLSARGKLRLLAEPLVRRGGAAGESAAAFAARRLGREATERLVGPFLTGVYAGDEARLDAEAVFPELVAAERRRGSIALGLAARALERGRPRGRAGTWSAGAGLESLAEALASRVGGALRLRARASEIAFEESAYRIVVQSESGHQVLRAKDLVLACPASESGALLRPLAPEAAEALEAIEYAPVASVSLGVDPRALRVAPRGFGFLVPRGEGDALLGCLFPSNLFPGRAPQGRALLTALVGGARRPEALAWPDDRLLAAVLAELDRALGLRGEPVLLGIARWPRAVPQPACGHPGRVAALRARIGRLPGLALAGAHLDGVAFGDALASGAAAAHALREMRRSER
jgi:oxygen-dependent protoporphyrinogen oxidase